MSIGLLCLLGLFVSNLSEDEDQERASFAVAQLVDFHEEWESKTDVLIADSLNFITSFGDRQNLLSELSNKGFSTTKDADEGYCVYENAKLSFWSSNGLDLPILEEPIHGLLDIEGSWYFFKTVSIDSSRKVLFYSTILRKYGVENEYIKGGYTSNFEFLNGFELHKKKKENAVGFTLNNRAQINYIVPSDKKAKDSSVVILFVEILAIITLLIGLCSIGLREKKWSDLTSLCGLVILRVFVFRSEFFAQIKDLQLFQPEVFAVSDFIPSFGDLLLHLVFGICFIAVLVKGQKSTIVKNLLAGVISLIIYCLTVELIRVILWNSNVPLEFNDLAALNEYSFLVLAMITGLLLTARILFELTIRKNMTNKHRAIGFVIFSVVAASLWLVFDYHWLSVLFPVPVYALSLKFMQLKRNFKFSIFRFFPELLLFSALFVFHIDQRTQTFDEVKINQILQKESQETDPIAEFYLEQTDIKFLEQGLSNQDAESIRRFFRSESYPKYLHRFDLSVDFDSTSIEDLESSLEQGAFVDYRKVKGNLYRKMSEGNMSYFLIFQIKDVEVKASYVARSIPKGDGFPSLLASGNIGKFELSKNYSFGKYRAGDLVANRGDFPYPSTFKILSPLSEENLISQEISEFEHGSHVHHILFEHGNTYVLSQSKESGSNLVNFSYIFFALAILMFISLLLWRWSITRKIFPEDFKSRLQYALLFILFFSTTITGVGSIYLLREQHQNENFEAISEKTRSILSLLEADGLEGNTGNARKIATLSNTFFTDINLYDPSGQLIESSQPSIFHEGILSKLMDTEAYWRLVEKSKVLHVQVEEIHGMSYLSAYAPLRGDDGQIKAILNLPYFAKTNEFENEINDFLFALINIYLLLTGLSVVLALFTSNRMVKPLKLIEEKISQITLKGTPENIVWENNDEIGALVRSYNKMVNELGENAKKLAEAEREGAWKEMAQQVAHEIKNPLTPMKLNIQHFQMKWSGLSPEEKESEGKRLANLLMEQIETLSAIASDFSNFSKISDPIFERLNLVQLVSNTVGLFEHTAGVSVNFVNAVGPEIWINADRDQSTRILNNVIKNAIQAVDGVEDPNVEIQLRQAGNKVQVSISDNGIGIPSDQAELIFQPKFTTKSSGMGLGLAMVKSMIEEMGGAISFTSQEGVGTTFLLTFAIA